MKNPFFTSVDVMKLTKDVLAYQPDDATITTIVANIKRDINPQFIAISVPLNASSEYATPPAPRTAESFTAVWCDAIHKAGMHVLFRGTLCELEGIYGFPKVVGSQRVTPGSLLTKINSAITNNPNWFADGDEFAPLPERTEMIFQDSTAFLTNLPYGYAQFFIYLMDTDAYAFTSINKRVGVCLTANNFTEVASGWIPREMFDRAGVVAIDHYPQTPDALAADIRAIHAKIGLPVVLEEWGNYWDGTPLKPFLDVIGVLHTEGTLAGFNYWGAWPGAVEGLLNDDWTVNARGKELGVFFASLNAPDCCDTLKQVRTELYSPAKGRMERLKKIVTRVIG